MQAYDFDPRSSTVVAGEVESGEVVKFAGHIAGIHERATIAEAVQAVRTYVKRYDEEAPGRAGGRPVALPRRGRRAGHGSVVAVMFAGDERAGPLR